MTKETGEPVIGGTFHLLIDAGDPRVRIMSYAVPFRAAGDGGLWVLRGRKVVQGGRVRDLWRSLTTMEATIQPAGEEESAPGWARIDTADVVRLVASIRVVGGDGRWGSVRGVWTFGRFFLSSVLEVYVAGIRAHRRRTPGPG